MYLTGLIQRDRLFDVAMRWLADELRPEDGLFATEVFTFEKLVTTPTGRAFLQDINRTTRSGPITSRRIMVKDDLRRAIASAPNASGERVRGLFERYHANPEDFYPGTPADFVLNFGAEGDLLGMVRFKRIRRIAEKVSRRMADRLSGAVHSVALSLRGPLDRGGHPESCDGLVPTDLTPDLMDRAEREVGRRFREQRLTFQPKQMRIDDLVGFKFVGTEDELERIERAIAEHPGVRGVEREVHRGKYNDVNLLVDLELPPVGALVDRLADWDWTEASGRGLDAATLRRDFPAYVESGARTFRTEVILTTFEELVESEFGNAIHEARILEQRSSAPYAGRLGQNASFIVEYLLMLAISPTVRVEALPVKLWGRYLPDVFSQAVWKLFGVEQSSALFDAILLDPEGAFSKA